jgi:23S rRNA (adenine2503-C2)-methyltransferase
MSLEELTEFFVSIGEKPYRARQVFKWLMNGAASWEEMTDVSKSLRARLAGGAIDTLRVCDVAVSGIDGTRKYLFETFDGLYVESVLMEYYYGWSVCISSQAGCRMGCRFCASGRHGLARDLTPGEIADQYILCERDVRRGVDLHGRPLGVSERVRRVKHMGDDGSSRIGHIVVMGVGEPFDNYDGVMTFLRNITNPHGRNLGRRQITVSTCGLLDGMRRFMEDLPQANLTLSLHAPNDGVRRRLMPAAAARCGVDDLIGFAREYYERTGRRFSFEYALFAGVNDGIMDADELADRLTAAAAGGSGVGAAARSGTGDRSGAGDRPGAPGFHVNLIPANPVPGLGFEDPDSGVFSEFKAPAREQVKAFAERLAGRGIRTTTRRELGSDIAAACGQLRSERMCK